MVSELVMDSLESLSSDMKALLMNTPGDILIRCEGEDKEIRVHSLIMGGR